MTSTQDLEYDVNHLSGRGKANADRLRRRVARLMKAGMLEMDGKVQVERAVTVADLTEAYSLVYAAYVEKRYITERSLDGVRVRIFETLSDMATFVAKVDDRIVAVLSVIPDNPDTGLPSDHIFRDEIDILRSGLVCEITNLAVASDYRSTSVFLKLTQACFAYALYLGASDFFIAISPGHAMFFRDILQFELWGEKKRYSEISDDVVLPMRLDLLSTRQLARRFDALMGPKDSFGEDFYFECNPFHGRIEEWQEEAASEIGG